MLAARPETTAAPAATPIPTPTADSVSGVAARGIERERDSNAEPARTRFAENGVSAVRNRSPRVREAVRPGGPECGSPSNGAIRVT